MFEDVLSHVHNILAMRLGCPMPLGFISGLSGLTVQGLCKSSRIHLTADCFRHYRSRGLRMVPVLCPRSTSFGFLVQPSYLFVILTYKASPS